MKSIQARWMAAFALFFLCQNSMAVLGEKDASVETDRKAIAAIRHASVAKQKYTVHEIATDGITVREYAGPDGTIYAVAWNGITHPDLSSLLGTYFSDFQAASKRAIRVRGRRPMSSTQGESVIVEKSGHMRSLRGRAYVPALLPEGVTPDEIR